jgi:hypothetical protein
VPPGQMDTYYLFSVSLETGNHLIICFKTGHTEGNMCIDGRLQERGFKKAVFDINNAGVFK